MENNKKLLLKFLFWFLLLLICVLVGISNCFALTTKTIYSSVNSSGTLQNANQYLYGQLSGGGTINPTSATVGNTVNGVSYGFSFYVPEIIDTTKTYSIIINFKSDDLLSSVQSGWITVYTCSGATCNENNLINMVKNNPNGYSSKLTLKFNPITSGSYFKVQIGGPNGEAITGVTNFGISSVQTDSENPSQDIINNQTNNTNNIISNNNTNTQDIINNQNQNFEELGSNMVTTTMAEINTQRVQILNQCTNGYSHELLNGKRILTDGSLVDDPDSYYTPNFVAIGSNVSTIYITNPLSSTPGYYFIFYDSAGNFLSFENLRTRSITVPSGAAFFKFSSTAPNTFIFKNSVCVTKIEEQTDELIENQNQNTQAQIDSQKVCLDKEYDLTYDNSEIKGKFLNSSGSLYNDENNGISEYIPFTKGDILITNSTNVMNAASFCLYDENKSLISCEAYSRRTSITVNLSYNGYARFTTSKNNNNITHVKLTYCTTGNQAIADQNEESEKTRKGILGKLGELFNTLFSDDDADVSGLDNMAGWLPPGPLDSIINLPLSLFNSLTNVLSGTCSPVVLTLPFVNQQLTLPCFDSYMSQYLTGFSTVWTFVGVTVSVFILYNYLLSLYKWVDDTLTLRENNLPGYYDDKWGGGA